MNRRPVLPVLLTCALFLATGCDRSGLDAKDRSVFSPISKGINAGASLKVYEGLPHQHYEPDVLKTELATKKTVLIHEFPFYEDPLSVTAADVEALRPICDAAGSFQSSDGMVKTCGGFHPDYCLVWNDGAATYSFLICFGCHEIKIFGPHQELPADIRDHAYREFATLLKKYRNQRPAPKLGLG